MLIDTHAHLNFRAFDEDREEVVKRALDNNVWMINVGSDYKTSKIAVDLAEKHEQGVYSAVGLHPMNLGKSFDCEKYKVLAKSPKVVAIGEIGLDYLGKPDKDRQKQVFLEQLDLAKELNLLIIFHCRKAHDDLLGMLKSEIRGVIHCFTGNWGQAKQYLDMGLCLGFNGIIYKLNLDEIIKKTPLERMLIETDCPYLLPLGRGGRNEPLYVEDIVRRIAELRKETVEKVAEITTQNAKEVFSI